MNNNTRATFSTAILMHKYDIDEYAQVQKMIKELLSESELEATCAMTYDEPYMIIYITMPVKFSGVLYFEYPEYYWLQIT